MDTKLDWAGSLGKKWADTVAAHDRLLGPFGEVGIAALGDISGKRILDIGCGAGSTSIAMGRAGAKLHKMSGQFCLCGQQHRYWVQREPSPARQAFPGRSHGLKNMFLTIYFNNLVGRFKRGMLTVRW